MIHQHWVEVAGGFAMLYLFEKRGEGLPWHKHEPTEWHDAKVLVGALRVTLPGGVSFDLQRGNRIELYDKFHELAALADDTIVLNRYVHGKPAAYLTLPDSERVSWIESLPLKFPLESI